ncbi:MAG: YajD family HNH nuclease [Immundisolibacteraceae bacterium]|nr:YajD family HNH nuclease [Immundisolibacteraceae bacterium]
MTKVNQPDNASNDAIVAAAKRNSDQRAKGYREKSLKLYPWICGRCSREFDRLNLKELTVHHRDHNHDNNPDDGSNWELLCLYCHDNEHQRQLEAEATSGDKDQPGKTGTHNPFGDLKQLLNKKP